MARLLGLELRELPDWNCCGASSAHAADETLAVGLAARNLAIAEKQGMDLVVPCAACYSRLKMAQKERHKEAGTGADVRILSLLEFFFASGLTDTVVTLRKRPLNDLKIACYYGCLLMRPPDVTGAVHHEFPEMMEHLLELLGALPVPWSYKTDCCGGSLVLSKPEIVLALTEALLDRAARAGAEAIAVACPLCQSNLDARQADITRKKGKDYRLPVFYFTELVGLSLGHPDAGAWFKRHFVDPSKLLAARGLL